MSAYSLLIAQLLVVVYCRRRLLIRAAPRPAGSCRAGPPRVQAVEGFLEGLARVAANEGASLKSVLICGRRLQFGSIRGLSELGVVVWFGGGVELSSVAVAGKTLRPSFVYDIAVGEHHIHGRRVSDEQIQAWADEAEAGYDLQRLPRPTPGRPPVGRGPARL